MMKKFLSLTIISVFAAGPGVAADVTGKVSFSGTPPKAAPIRMAADPGCAKVNAGKNIMDESVVVNPNKTLKNVFVYVKEGVKNAPPADMTPVTFDQNGCTYHPHAFGIRVGQPLKIINSDPVMHNVHALPKTNSGFNMGMATKGMTIEKKFMKPETGIKIKCDVHGWMTAWAHVIDHPYFAVTDDKGNYTLKDLPPGEYTIEAIHEKLGTKTTKLAVTAAAGTADLVF